MAISYRITFQLSNLSIESMDYAMNPKNYECIAISRLIANKKKNLRQKDVNSSRSLMLNLFGKKWWSENAKVFTRTTGFGYDENAKAWEFTAVQKINGTLLSTKYTPLKGESKTYSPLSATLKLNFRVQVDQNNCYLKVWLADCICQQRQMVVVERNNLERDYGDFLVDSKSALFISKTCIDNLNYKLADDLVLLQYSISKFEAVQGDYIAALHAVYKKSPSLQDVRIITQCNNTALKKFPYYKMADIELQNAILQEAIKQAKTEISREGKIFLSESVFSKSLYFEITKRHLDKTMVIGRSVRNLTLQKWGREHFRGGPSILLCKEEDWNNIDYSKIRVDNLVWVNYEEINIPAYQMFNILIPTTSDKKIEENYSSYLLPEENNEIEEL